MSMSWLEVLSPVKNFVRALFDGDSSRSILPFVPRPIRYILLFVLILSSRSLPLVWHLRVFRPVLYVRFKALLLKLSSSETKEAWLDNMCPVGKSPFSLKETYTTWASPDESDYNMHLSNSSYAKVLDMCRLKFALGSMVTLFRDDCWIALGATHLKFLREIPIGTKYEIRMYLGSWDNKWIYIVSRFVSKSNKTAASGDERTRERIEGAKEALKDTQSSANGIAFPQFHTPSVADASGFTTPDGNQMLSAAEFGSVWAEAPGETLHCIAMNEICFKHGRLTVPPVLAFAAAGCGLSPEKWAEVKKLRQGKGMRELILGGWRNVPEEERWWEQALKPFEEERVQRLGVLKAMREGLEAARLL